MISITEDMHQEIRLIAEHFNRMIANISDLVEKVKIITLKQKESETKENYEGALLKEEVTEEEVSAVLSKWTGIPVSRLLEGEREKLLRLEDDMSQRVIGQGEAVEAVTNAILRARAGLKDVNRPIGSFIFLGPTGVGKTELAKTLARNLFDSEENIIRIDMS